MVTFKLCISDPSTGKSFQKEVKDSLAMPFIGLNVGETIKGENINFSGYEFQITGGSDYCGFPMRKGILGLRKSMVIYRGVGFRGNEKGIKRRKTVCGHKINEKISQINLKVIKQGSAKLAEIFGVAEPKEEKKAEAEAAGKEVKEEAKREEKIESKEQKLTKRHKGVAEEKKEKEDKESKEQKEEKKEVKSQADEKEHKKSATEHKEEKK